MCNQRDAQRLAGYDRLYTDVLAERDQIAAQMDRLRQQGKVNSATYQQLIANKLTVQNLISRFEIYGISPPE